MGAQVGPSQRQYARHATTAGERFGRSTVVWCRCEKSADHEVSPGPFCPRLSAPQRGRPLAALRSHDERPLPLRPRPALPRPALPRADSTGVSPRGEVCPTLRGRDVALSFVSSSDRACVWRARSVKLGGRRTAALGGFRGPRDRRTRSTRVLVLRFLTALCASRTPFQLCIAIVRSWPRRSSARSAPRHRLPRRASLPPKTPLLPGRLRRASLPPKTPLSQRLLRPSFAFAWRVVRFPAAASRRTGRSPRWLARAPARSASS